MDSCAQSQGFEPWDGFGRHTISSRAPSTTQPTLHISLTGNDAIVHANLYSVKLFFT